MHTKAGIKPFITVITLLLLCVQSTMAQRFINLTADEVTIDSVIPHVCYTMPLPTNHADSTYSAVVKYAEYIDMTAQDIEAYKKLSNNELPPTTPMIMQDIVTTNKKSYMIFSLAPFVFKDGKCQILASYMLAINSAPVQKAKGTSRANDASSRYAEHSVLASGKWAKIRVSESGFHTLTGEVIRRAGFRDLNKVKIYGYGGNLVPEILTDSYLRETDDLKELPSALINGKRVFYAKGPVSWESMYNKQRTRNPYSNYGYYFITETEEDPLIVSDAELLEANHPTNDAYHTLHEIDNYAWMEGGRNLVESTAITSSKTYKLAKPKNDEKSGSVTVVVSANTNSSYTVTLNGTELGKNKLEVKEKNHDKAAFATATYTTNALEDENEIKITVTSGGPVRLDYIDIASYKCADAPDLATAALPAAEYVHNITNQDHHADTAVDLTILIPTSQLFLEQATRLKKFHEEKDGMTVRIVPADELYNEFSSGTPDVSAYRRYMKMMYDRAKTEAEQPKHLLLFGDCVWDNRLVTSECRQLNADNLLLCFESENSYNAVDCYVSDDFIAMLDDNEAIMDTEKRFRGTPDIAIGRLPATNETLATIMVNKTINYGTNANVGPWQNTIMFLGDDGNENLHMKDVNIVADDIIKKYPGYHVKKVYWDAYKRIESSTGKRYPEVEDAIRSQQQAGALIIDYAGHGSATSISHEYVLRISDFASFTNTNLPLWVTASCDIGPFDGTQETIGETILTNSKGGGIGFFGTTRTVYANYNKFINDAFMKAVLSSTNGKAHTLGEANKLAKCYITEEGLDLTVNKLHYSLLADPALRLNLPQSLCVVDSINGTPVNGTALATVSANSKIRVKGHIEKNGQTLTDMNGFVSMLVRDNIETISCLQNDKQETTSLFQFQDRTKSLFSGTDSIANGQFDITFSVPRDINYSDKNGLITLFAYNNDASVTAHGETDRFIVGGSTELPNDSIGPSIYCYLNSPSFVNGDDVNATPYFVAEVKDKDGINASGSGIGHDLQLVIDNQLAMTYNLNDNFKFDFGSYTSGSTFYSIPTLSEGQHTLRFRAWDILNNPSSVTLTFNVVSSKRPTIVDVNATKNPAKTTTTFIATHDRPGSVVNMKVEIFDMSGRLLHTMSQSTTTNSATSAMDWDLTTDSGSKLQTGVYLYRVNVSGEGTALTSKAKKLIIIN